MYAVFDIYWNTNWLIDLTAETGHLLRLTYLKEMEEVLLEEENKLLAKEVLFSFNESPVLLEDLLLPRL